MVLAQKQTHRSMEQNRERRNKPTLTWSINLPQRMQKYTMGKTVSLIKGAGKTGQLHEKNQTELLSHTTYKNKHKMD